LIREAFEFELIVTDYRVSGLIDITLISVKADQNINIYHERLPGGL